MDEYPARDSGSRHINVRVVCEALDRTQADVLVTTTTKKLAMSNGHLSAAILNSAGPEIQRECNTSYPMGLHRGEVAVTRGYKLQCQRVYHGCLGKFHESRKDEYFGNLRQIITDCLTRANAAGFKSIAFPALGTGKLRYPCSTVAAQMFSCIDRFRTETQSTNQSLDTILLVVYPGDGESLKEFKKIEEDLNSEANVQQSIHINDDGDSTATPIVDHVGKVTCQEYTALVMVYSELFNRLQDEGVAFRYDSDTVRLTGHSKQVEKAKKDMQAAVEDLRTMHQITVSVRKIDSTVIDNEIRNTNSKFPKVVFVRDPLRGVVSTFGYELIEVQVAHAAFSEVIISKETLKTPPGSSKGNSYDDEKNKNKSCGYTSSKRDACFSSTDGKNIFTYHAGDIVVKMYVAQVTQVAVDCVIQTVKSNSTTTDTSVPDDAATQIGLREEGTGIKKVKKELSNPKTEASLHEKEILRVELPCWWDYTPITKRSLRRLEDVMYKAIVNVLLETGRSGHKSVCIAVGSFDVFRVPQEISSAIYAKGIRTFSYNRYSIEVVHVVVEDMSTMHVMQTTFQSILTEGNNTCFDVTRYIEANKNIIPTEEFSDTDSDDSSGSYEPVIGDQDKTEAPASHILKDDQSNDCDNDNVIQKQVPVPLVDSQNVGKRKSGTDIISAGRGSTMIKHEYQDGTSDPNHTEVKPQPNVSNQPSVFRNGDSDDEQNALPPPLCREDGNKLLCFFPPGKKIMIYTGDISELKNIDAIVCSEDKSGGALGKIAKRLVQLGGKAYKAEKEAAFQKHPDIGDVVVTNGGQNIYKWVIHALLPHNQPDAIEVMIIDILEEASKRKMNSIAMALLGTGWKPVSDLQAEVLFRSYSRFCRKNLSDNLIVHVVNIDPVKTNAVKDTFRRNIELLRHRICED